MAVETAVVIVPTFFLAIFLLVQMTFVHLTHTAAQSAAEHAADAVAAREGTVSDGMAVANEIMQATGYTSESSTVINVGGGVARAEVTARPIALLVTFTVTGSAQVPVEEFRSSEVRE